MSSKNTLTASQDRKLAALKARNLCFVVLDGSTFVCLTHDRKTDNATRCSEEKRAKKK